MSVPRLTGFQRFASALEKRGTSVVTPLVAATFVACVRITEEHLFVNLPRGLRRDPLVWLGHTGAFYLALTLAVAALVRVGLRRSREQALGVASAGIVLGVLPPLVNLAVSGAGAFSYEYRPDLLASFSWTLYDPVRGTPLGEALTVWLSLAFVLGYARACGATWWRTLVVGAAYYALALAFLTVLPSAGLWLFGGRGLSASEGLVLPLVVAGTAAVLVLGPAAGRRALRTLPQIALAPLLVAVGAALLAPPTQQTLLAAVVLALAAAGFAVANGHHDQREDAAGGRASGVTAADGWLLLALQVPCWLVLGPGHFFVALAGLVFAVVGLAYHADPLRLKCVFPLSYKTEGFLAATALLAGILAEPRRVVPLGTLGLVLLIAGGISVGAMFKDFKDVAADGASGVRSVYVVFGARGIAEQRVHTVVVALLAACLVVPPVYLAARGAGLAAVAGLGVVAAVMVVALALARAQERRATAAAVALVALDVYLGIGAVALSAL